MNHTRLRPFNNGNKPLAWYSCMFLLLSSITAAAQINSMLQLPENYRTPLSVIIENSNPAWRAAPEEQNPWREDNANAIINPRIKAEFFPKYDYETVDDPTTRSLFQNEFELERPRTNLFKYSF